MGLKEGDSVTLSVGFPVKIAEYEYMKPHASVTRVMSDDLAGDLESLEAGLREAVLRSTRECIFNLNDLVSLIDEHGGDLAAVAEALATELGGSHESGFEVQAGEKEKKPKQKGPKKKGGLKGKVPKKKKTIGG